ncbi:MAG: transcription termination/antitermination protein NusG [Planctomycetota bacterium]
MTEIQHDKPAETDNAEAAQPDAAQPDTAQPVPAQPEPAEAPAPGSPAPDGEAPASSDESADESAEAAEAMDGRQRGSLDEDEPVRQAGMDWFVLRVASNKESSVQNTLLRKVQIETMTHLVGRILVPTEKTKTIKNGKQRITETKLYPGYVFVEMQLEEDGRIPQDVFFLIKETTGVGDFVGTAGRPTPMAQHEIEKMLLDSKKPDDEPTIKLSFEKGENVIIREGPFENYEGTVDELLPDKGLVRVLVTIFGRQAPIELEEWQIAKVDDA